MLLGCAVVEIFLISKVRIKVNLAHLVCLTGLLLQGIQMSVPTWLHSM